jgi:hypothetical protein
MDQQMASRYNQLTQTGVPPSLAQSSSGGGLAPRGMGEGIQTSIPMGAESIPTIGSARLQPPASTSGTDLVQVLGVLYATSQETPAVEAELKQAAVLIMQAMSKLGMAAGDETNFNTLA